GRSSIVLLHRAPAHRALRRRPRRFWLGLSAGLPAARASARCLAPYSETASARAETDALGATTSTRSPNSSAVFSVSGPITAITVVLCRLPAMPTRLRTVEEEVNRTASNAPPLVASRTGAGGGAARTVR